MFDAPSSSSFGSGFSDNKQDSVKAGFSTEHICGAGASCIVYQMRIEGIRVAVKRLREEHKTNPTFVASYRKEYQIGQRLKHDALPIYRDYYEGCDDVYIVMDYVDGISLEEFLETKEGQEYFKSRTNVRRFIFELLNVVTYLHRSGVIHCDIKPGNLILRNSDRGLMLIDFDKAYSDTLDLTHGGTSNFSEPLSGNAKPTSRKDFRAIGKIIDVIVSQVKDFPYKKFKQFRNACDSDEVSADSLLQILTHPAKSNWYILLIGIVIITTIIASLIATNRKTTQTVLPSESIKIVQDTVVQIVSEPVLQDPPQHNQTFRIDFDSKMESFIALAENALVELNDTTISNSAILDLITEVTESYTTTYSNIVNDTKAQYPEASGMDIELVVSSESERSRAFRLFQTFTQAAADTAKARNVED